MEDGSHGIKYISRDASECIESTLDLQVRGAAAGVRTSTEDVLLVDTPVRHEFAVSEVAGEVAPVPPARARRSLSRTEHLTPAVEPSTKRTLDILMAAGVPKRREGGVATIVYNLGREMQDRGHRVTYVSWTTSYRRIRFHRGSAS